jgi:hypothetical protein
MMRGRTGAAVCFAASVLASAAHADDNDLDRIPQAANTPQQAAPQASANQVFFLQDDFIVTARRDNLLVPFPPPPVARWEERLFADARYRWALSNDLDIVYSGRLNLRAEDGLDFPSHEDVRHDFREGYLAWKVDDETFVDVGRINLKSGVALGFNPTDFFKTRAVVEPLSADPSVLREDRLGTLMAYAQHLWENGALTIAAAPRLYDPSAIYLNTDLPSFNPVFDRTNAATRLLVKGNVTLFDDFNPEFLAYAEDGHWRFGTNLTHGFGQQIVGYLEWAGGDRADLATDAFHYGQETGTIPLAAPSPLPLNSARGFDNDAAVGFSYTTESKITFNLEYHYHQAGFSDADWQNWFGAGTLHNSSIDAALWYIRGYAADQQEPLDKQDVFLRADWQDAFVEDLDITAFIDTDARDFSSFAQATADYYVSREWTVGALASGTWGGKHSDYGSLPGAATVLFKVSRYF